MPPRLWRDKKKHDLMVGKFTKELAKPLFLRGMSNSTEKFDPNFIEWN